MDQTDWVAWHKPYDEPGSSLARRLTLVRLRIAQMLDAAPPGHVQLISMCAGQGRDVLGVLVDHPRREDVHAGLVELDEGNVALARAAAQVIGLTGIEIVRGDASTTSVYESFVPADLVLVCGVFGNIPDVDVRTTIENLPRLCKPGAGVIWTRHRRPPDLTPAIRTWFSEAGFAEEAFDSEEGFALGVGTHRLSRAPSPFVRDVRLFDFTGDGQAAHL